jgi:hypothetical protein
MKIGKYEYFISDKIGKKLFTIVNDKKIYFGDTNYQHYYDKTGLLSKSTNHLDKKRQEAYFKRASKIKDKAGNLTANDPNSPNYHSLRIIWLWDGKIKSI